MSEGGKRDKRITDLRLIKKAMRHSKRQALRSGLSLNTDIAAYIIRDTLHFRGRDCDDAVWFALALQAAGNTRECERDDDDDAQGVFDLSTAVPIRIYQLMAELPDGRRAVKQDGGWMILSDEGEEPAAERDIKECARNAEPQYVNTRIVRVRDFSVTDGDQRTMQMRENIERDTAAYDRWVRGWKLIRPLLLEHPLWTLGHAVDDLRDRGEWPEDLDYSE